MNKFFKDVKVSRFEKPEIKVIAPARALIAKQDEFKKVEDTMFLEGYSLYLSNPDKVSDKLIADYVVVELEGLPVYFKDNVLMAKKTK